MNVAPIIPAARGVTAPSIGLTNCAVVGLSDDLQTIYDWLASSDRDTAMGAASATNRRTLFLEPGVWTVTSTFTLDTLYIDVVSLSNNYEDTIITRTTAGAVVEQTVNDVRLVGFTIYHQGSASGDHGLDIDTADNTASKYVNMQFLMTGADTSTGSVFGTQGINGYWEGCYSTNGFCTLTDGQHLGAVMWNITTVGIHCFGYNANAATTSTITGKFYYCRGEATLGVPFGATSGMWRIPCTSASFFWCCTSGNNSFSVNNEFAGQAYYCSAGTNSFAGTTSGANPATFSGYAYSCTSTGGASFGMGHASSVQSGKIINCRNGSEGDYAGGRSGASESTLTDNGAKATLTSVFTGDNNDITYTAVNEGSSGLPITVDYDVAMNDAVTISTLAQLLITVSVDNGDASTANDLIAIINADTTVSQYVLASIGEGTGNGAIDSAEAGALAVGTLTGGVDPPFFKGNHPDVPAKWPVGGNVKYFDNGWTYTNAGASGAATFSLPAARVGFQFHFEVVVAQELRIDPNGTETIALAGTQQAAGKYITANAVGERCTLTCTVAGQWEQSDVVGTWTAEA
jgi:hypothetical protein